MPVEGRDLSSRQTQYVVKDMEIGKPINSDKCSEAADGVARESEGVKSCPRAGCGRSASDYAGGWLRQPYPEWRISSAPLLTSARRADNRKRYRNPRKQQDI